MDLLKQLEAKIQALVGQRNQLREEVEHQKALLGPLEEELQGLRRRCEDLQSEKANLTREREEVRQEIEAILKQVEALS